MNREIKFRAWDNVYKDFNDTVAANILLQLHEPYVELDEEYNKRFFLSQFTGLKDNNGTEIYEFDIIYCGGKEYMCEWVNNSAGYAWKTKSGNYIYPFCDLCKEAIIIGNIYEGKK